MIGIGTAIPSSSTKIPTTTAGTWPTTRGSAPTPTSNTSARGNARRAGFGGMVISGCALTIQTHYPISLGDESRLQPASKTPFSFILSAPGFRALPHAFDVRKSNPLGLDPQLPARSPRHHLLHRIHQNLARGYPRRAQNRQRRAAQHRRRQRDRGPGTLPDLHQPRLLRY